MKRQSIDWVKLKGSFILACIVGILIAGIFGIYYLFFIDPALAIVALLLFIALIIYVYP